MHTHLEELRLLERVAAVAVEAREGAARGVLGLGGGDDVGVELDKLLVVDRAAAVGVGLFELRLEVHLLLQLRRLVPKDLEI